MPNWEQKVGERLANADKFASLVLKKIKKVIGLSAYWSAVFVVGISVTGGIMYASGIPFTTGAEAGGISGALATVLGMIIYYTNIYTVGILLAIVGWILEYVITYPWGGIWPTIGAAGYVNVPAVVTGWETVRNVSNVFFSLILVIIALATVLKIEAYSWKQLLPKFVIMAVLINFSKSIAGIFTDMATVAMATFGGSFSGKFAASILTGFGLVNLNSLNPGSGSSSVSDLGVLAAFIAAAIMVNVTFVILLVYTIALLMRIVALWILIVLSPIAYVTRILPVTQRYSSMWWETFGRWVLLGPLMTFFLWLSLTMAFGTGGEVGNGGGASPLHQALTSEESTTSLSARTSGAPTAPDSAFQATSATTLANFLIMTVLMIASLKFVYQMASEGAGALKSVEGLGKSVGKGMRKFQARGLATVGGKARTAGTEKEGDGAVARFGKFGLRGIGNVSQVLAGTTSRAGDYLKDVQQGIAKASEAKSEKSQRQLNERAGELMNADVTNDKGGLSAVNMFKRMMGTTMAAGSSNAEHVFDRVISGRGALNLAETVKETLPGGKYRKNAEIEKENERLRKERETAPEEGFTEDRQREIAPQLEEASQTAKRAQQALAGDTSVDLNLKDAAIQVALQERRDSLQSSLDGPLAAGLSTRDKRAMQAEIDDIDNALGEDGKWEDIAGTDIGNRAAEAMRDASEAQRDALLNELRAGGGDADEDGKITKDGNFVITKGSIDAQLAKNGIEQDRLRNELAARRPGTNAAARNARNAAVAEHMKNLDQYPDSSDLRQYLDRAQVDKDSALAEAVMKRIFQNGDENDMLGPWLKEMMGKNPEKYTHPVTGEELKPGSDNNGMELFRQFFLRDKLGMTEQGSMRTMSDLSFTAMKNGHLGAALGYTYKAGKLVPVAPDIASANMAGETLKGKVHSLKDMNRLAFVKEDGDGAYAGLLGSTAKILNGFAQDLANENGKHFKQLSANMRQVLSQDGSLRKDGTRMPNVIHDLEEAKVDKRIIKLLKQYRAELKAQEKE